MNKTILDTYTFAWWDEHEDKRWMSVGLDDSNVIVVSMGIHDLHFDSTSELEGFIDGLNVALEKLRKI